MFEVIPYDLLEEDEKFELDDFVGNMKKAGLDLYVIAITREDEGEFISFRILNLSYVIQVFVKRDKLSYERLMDEIEKEMANRLENSYRMYNLASEKCNEIREKLGIKKELENVK